MGEASSGERFLVLGGGSSVGSRLIASLLDRGINVTATSRDPNSARLHHHSQLSWSELNLEDRWSCENFARSLIGTDYSHAILSIGALSGFANRASLQIGDAEAYLGSMVSRYCWVISEIISRSSGSVRVLNISSRAAIYGSWDQYYAVSKASVEVLLRSLHRKHQPRVQTISLVAGLIESSGMASNFLPEEIESHRRRAPAPLLTVEKTVHEIERALFDPDFAWDGRSELIGPDYQ